VVGHQESCSVLERCLTRRKPRCACISDSCSGWDRGEAASATHGMAYLPPFQRLEAWRIGLQTDHLPPRSQRAVGGRYAACAFPYDEADDDGARGGEVWQRITFPDDIWIVAVGVLSSNRPARLPDSRVVAVCCNCDTRRVTPGAGGGVR